MLSVIVGLLSSSTSLSTLPETNTASRVSVVVHH